MTFSQGSRDLNVASVLGVTAKSIIACQGFGNRLGFGVSIIDATSTNYSINIHIVTPAYATYTGNATVIVKYI